jgi:hypothetical protein
MQSSPLQDSILATIESMKVTLANLARRTCQQALEQVSVNTSHYQLTLVVAHPES